MIRLLPGSHLFKLILSLNEVGITYTLKESPGIHVVSFKKKYANLKDEFKASLGETVDFICTEKFQVTYYYRLDLCDSMEDGLRDTPCHCSHTIFFDKQGNRVGNTTFIRPQKAKEAS
jgi:hypothetical protein